MTSKTIETLIIAIVILLAAMFIYSNLGRVTSGMLNKAVNVRVK